MSAATPKGGGIPTARSVDHFAVTVPDLGEAVDFFTSALGGEHVYTTGIFSDPDGDWMRTNINVDERASLRIAMVRLGPTTNVELFEYDAPDQRTTQPKNSDIGGHHIAFYVDDIHLAVEYLTTLERVVVLGAVTDVGEGQPNQGGSFVYFLTPWGMQLELISAPHGYAYEQTGGPRLAAPAPHWHNTKE